MARRPIAVYFNKPTINDRIVTTRSYSWKGVDFKKPRNIGPRNIKMFSIKPGELLQSKHREFPIDYLYCFNEDERAVELRWMYPMDILQEPFGWPNNWGLVPIAKLPLEQFEIPPLMFLGKIFVIRNTKGFKSFSMSPISSIYRGFHGSDALLGFLFKDREVYVPSCDLYRFSLIEQ